MTEQLNLGAYLDTVTDIKADEKKIRPRTKAAAYSGANAKKNEAYREARKKASKEKRWGEMTFAYEDGTQRTLEWIAKNDTMYAVRVAQMFNKRAEGNAVRSSQVYDYIMGVAQSAAE